MIKDAPVTLEKKKWFSILQAACFVNPAEKAIENNGVFVTFETLFQHIGIFSEYILTRLPKESTSASTSTMCIYMERGIESIVTVFASSYLGLQLVILPIAPERRAQIVLKNCSPALVCVDKKHEAKEWLISWNTVTLNVDTFIRKIDLKKLPTETGPSALGAIVGMCSSGSTGAPKLIMRSESSFSHRLRWVWDNFPFVADDQSIQKSAFTTTHGLYEILEPLLAGSSLHILKDVSKIGVREFWNCVKDCHTRRILAVPTLLAMSAGIKIPSCVELLFMMGEAPSLSLCRDTFDFAQMYSIYGCTEASSALVLDISKHLSLTPEAPFTLGMPLIDEIQCWTEADDNIYNPNEGVLHFSGPHLFNGYFNQEKLTSEVLRYDNNKSCNVFNTRDLVKLVEHEYIYVGRTDDVVKVHGNRVELGEINSQLRDACIDIEACVSCYDEKTNSVVVFVSPLNVNADVLKIELQARVPAYMVPNSIFVFDELPTAANGKVNRQSCQQLLTNMHRMQETSCSLKKINDEGDVVEITENDIRVAITDLFPELTIDSNFQESGLASTAALQIIKKVSSITRAELSPLAVYDNPSIRKFSKYVFDLCQKSSRPRTPIEKDDIRITTERGRHSLIQGRREPTFLSIENEVLKRKTGNHCFSYVRCYDFLPNLRRLENTLETLLSSEPWCILAGRLVCRGKTCTLLDNNAGVVLEMTKNEKKLVPRSSASLLRLNIDDLSVGNTIGGESTLLDVHGMRVEENITLENVEMFHCQDASTGDSTLLRIRISLFEDGFALCASFAHIVCDGWSAIEFLKAWMRHYDGRENVDTINPIYGERTQLTKDESLSQPVVDKRRLPLTLRMLQSLVIVPASAIYARLTRSQIFYSRVMIDFSHKELTEMYDFYNLDANKYSKTLLITTFMLMHMHYRVVSLVQNLRPTIGLWCLGNLFVGQEYLIPSTNCGLKIIDALSTPQKPSAFDKMGVELIINSNEGQSLPSLSGKLPCAALPCTAWSSNLNCFRYCFNRVNMCQILENVDGMAVHCVMRNTVVKNMERSGFGKIQSLV